MAKPTDLIHHPYRPPAEFDAPMQGTYKASTVFFPNMAASRARTWVDKSAYTYGLHGTPSTFTLEARLATLEGAKHVILTPSGLSAITTVDMAFLAAGDTVVLPDNVYGSRKPFVQQDLARWGIGCRWYDGQDVQSLRQALDATVRLVWLEGAGSVTLEFPDLRGLVRCVREHATPGTLVAIDHTWGAGIAYQPFDLGEGLGADIAIHALTKYPSGGGDVMMGSISCVDQAVYEKLAWAHCRSGLGVGGNDVELVLRNLPTLHLRYAEQDAAARRVAQWCTGQRAFARVLHPALPGSPGHEHWVAHCSAAAGLLTVELDPRFTSAQADAVIDALQLFRIGWSWGGPVSLVASYRARGMRSLSTPYQGTLVRLCIGLEDVDDLIADLANALKVLPPG